MYRRGYYIYLNPVLKVLLHLWIVGGNDNLNPAPVHLSEPCIEGGYYTYMNPVSKGLIEWFSRKNQVKAVLTFIQCDLLRMEFQYLVTSFDVWH